VKTMNRDEPDDVIDPGFTAQYLPSCGEYELDPSYSVKLSQAQVECDSSRNCWNVTDICYNSTTNNQSFSCFTENALFTIAHSACILREAFYFANVLKMISWRPIISGFTYGPIFTIFTARRLAKRGICRRRVSVCLSVSVCVCVCLSVTLRYCIKTAKRRITQITPHDSPWTLVF